MRRPLRQRIWFSKPQWYWFGWKTLKPYDWGGDEFWWHVWTIGFVNLGQVHIAVRPCPGTNGLIKKCHDEIEFLKTDGIGLDLSGWPVDTYGHNHIRCGKPDCYCKHEEEA